MKFAEFSKKVQDKDIELPETKLNKIEYQSKTEGIERQSFDRILYQLREERKLGQSDV